MSFERGQMAVNLEMPPKIPRFELAAESDHLDLVKVVTGMDVNADSSPEDKLEASKKFIKIWDYDILLSPAISHNALDKKRTRMGHAEWTHQGRDFDNDIYCPFKTPEEVLAFDPWETYGKKSHSEIVKIFNEKYHTNRNNFPDLVNMTGIYITLMSGVLSIFGWDMLLMAAGVDQDGFGQVVNRYSSWIQQYYDALADSDASIVYCHDDLVWSTGAFMSPDWYRKYIFPNLKRLWEPLRDAGKKILYAGDGNLTQFIDDIVKCGNSGFWFECFTDLQYVTEKYGQTHIIIGNGDTRILTFKSKDKIEAEVRRCLDLGKNCPGYFMCMSGHIPPNVPIENALFYNDLYQKLSLR